jgi:Ohr subfamily peroxiredoxin
MDVVSEVVYRANVSVTGGRVGRATSDDGLLDIALARPGSSDGVNPEQLLAAGWGACFLSTVHALGRKSGIDTSRAEVAVGVVLGKNPDQLFALRAEFDVSIPGLATDVVADLVEQAHGRCPYSRALAGSIEIRTMIDGAAA